MQCMICRAPAHPFAATTLLGKYPVAYYRCTRCGLVRTEEPYWLEEAYSTAITGSDVGLVQRNNHLAQVAKVIISFFFDKHGRFLDYAGGYGLFVRLMRDSGFDFRWHDKYCDNIFAKGFELPADAGPFDMVTAFEVFEHLANPLEEISRMLSFSGNILFTTQMLPEPAPKPGEWWFYGLEHGQHISFYTRKSLEEMGAKFGLNLYSNGTSMHLLTKERIYGVLFSLLARYKISRFLGPFCHGRSLLPSDYKAVSGGEI